MLYRAMHQLDAAHLGTAFKALSGRFASMGRIEDRSGQRFQVFQPIAAHEQDTGEIISNARHTLPNLCRKFLDPRSIWIHRMRTGTQSARGMLVAGQQEQTAPTMKTAITILCLSLGSAIGLHAQEPGTLGEAARQGDTKCLMKSNTATWKALGLTPARSKQAQDIVARCTEHAAHMSEEERIKPQPLIGLESHVQELNNLLTEEEFKAWIDQCNKQGYEMPEPIVPVKVVPDP